MADEHAGSVRGEAMSMHTDFARPAVRKWIARNKPRSYHFGDVLVFIVALIILGAIL